MISYGQKSKSKLKLLVSCMFLFLGAKNVQAKPPFVSEYWTWNTGPSSGVGFKHILFIEGGKYLYESGYSGGAYICDRSSGTYSYNKRTQSLRFDVAKKPDRLKKKWWKLRGYNEPGELKIIDITDSTVTLKPKKAAANDEVYTYVRSFGYVPDQKWMFSYPQSDSTAWKFSMHIKQSGQTIVDVSELDLEDNFAYPEGKFECRHSIQDGIMYLSVLNITKSFIGEKQLEPALEVCVRIDLKRKLICAEDMLFFTDYDHRKQTPWSFASGRFTPNTPLPSVGDSAWVKLKKYKEEA